MLDVDVDGVAEEYAIDVENLDRASIGSAIVGGVLIDDPDARNPLGVAARAGIVRREIGKAFLMDDTNFAMRRRRHHPPDWKPQ